MDSRALYLVGTYDINSDRRAAARDVADGNRGVRRLAKGADPVTCAVAIAAVCKERELRDVAGNAADWLETNTDGESRRFHAERIRHEAAVGRSEGTP